MKQRLLSTLLLIYPLTGMADTAVTVTAASDYLFNGISQTDSHPALQSSLDWTSPSGLYLGMWGSNVDYGNDTNMEVDLSGGYTGKINETINYKLNLAYYTYHGADYSKDTNYGELNGNLIFSSGTTVGVSYAWDYAGTEAGHYIVALTQALELGNGLTLKVGVDSSVSLDEDKHNWFGKKSYVHYFAAVNSSISGFDLSLGVHGTNVDDNNDPTNITDPTVLLTVARTFNF